MAFDPFAQYNVADPYGVSPSQRLSQTLAGTAYKSKGLQRGYQRDRFDLSKAYKKQIPKIETGMARRGLQDSGIRNLALAEGAAGYERQRTERQAALQEALFNIAAERLGAYGGYAGSRYQNVLAGAQSRGESAARIREALS